MEEREEEYQRARERIFAHDVRNVCVGGDGEGGGGAMLHTSLCRFYSCANSKISCYQLALLDLRVFFFFRPSDVEPKIYKVKCITRPLSQCGVETRRLILMH